MAILRGAQAEEWIRKNPGKSYTDITGGATKTQDLGFIGNLLKSISQPFRMGGGVAQEFGYTLADLIRMAQGKGQLERPETYAGLSQEESQRLYEDPLKEGLKSGAGVLSYAVPAGAAKGITSVGGRIGSAALRGAGAGTLGGFAYSGEDQELAGALKGAGLGALMGGALQGIGEGAKALTKTAGTGKVVNTLDVDEIAKLPSKTRSGLVKQAKSAGFWDGGLSESKNIQNYLTNRGLAGNTPAETLENLTQEFRRATKLKQEGLKEIGGLSRGYTEQIKNNLDEAIRYKGIGLDSETTKVYNDIVKTLKKGPQGAKELDDIVMRWNEAGRLASGAQKTSIAGLYADAAKAVRDTMRSIPAGTKYDQGLRAINQVLGVEDAGLVAKAAKSAEGVGLNIPLFSAAGFRNADIKTPAISNAISKVQAAIGRTQETGGSGILGEGFSNILQNAATVGQRAVPAITGLTAGTQGVGTQPTYPTTQGVPQGMEAQGISPLNLMLAQEVLNGNISAAEANAVLSLLGMGGTGGQKMTEKQKMFKSAGQTAAEALAILESGAAKTGKVQGVGSAIGKFFGTQDPAQTEYLAKLDGARMAAISALSGANVPPSEYERMRNLIPEPNDEYNVAVEKLRAFQQVMDTYAQSYGGTDTSTDILQTLGLQ